MNIVPTNMLGTAAQSIQGNPMFLMQEMLKKFEQAKLASLQAGQERTAQYQQTQEQRATDIERAGEQYATAPKTGAADIALTAASLILPVIGALLPQGRGLRGQRAKAGQQQALTGLGQGLGAVQQYRLGREETGRERRYTGEMKGIEHLSGLADMIYQGQERQAATQMGAAGTQAQLGMRGLGVAAQYQKAMQPKPEKPPFTPTQLYQQGRNIASDTRKQALIEANQIIQSLDLGGQRFTIKSRQDLDAMIFELEQGDVLSVKRGLPPAQTFPRTNAVAPILARLKELRDHYDTGAMGDGQTGKPPDMTDAEWQEYLQMKGR